jgi:hypothetical protein
MNMDVSGSGQGRKIDQEHAVGIEIYLPVSGAPIFGPSFQPTQAEKHLVPSLHSHLGARSLETVHLPLLFHLHATKGTKTSPHTSLDTNTPCRSHTNFAMPKQKSRESSGPSGEKPYERTLRSTARVNCSDADILELADLGRAVDQHVAAEAIDGCVTRSIPLRLADVNLV